MLFIIFIVGFIVGLTLNKFIHTNGTLYITKEQDGQYLFLELSNDISHLNKVTFKVSKNKHPPQK